MPEILAGNACLKCHHWRIQCALFTFDATQSNGQETVEQHVILEQQWCAMFTKRPQAVVPLVALRLPCVFYIFPLNLLPQKICASSPIILVCVNIFKLCKLVFLYLLGRLMMRVVVHLYAVWWCSLLRGGRPPPAAHSAQPRPLFQLLLAATNTDMMHCHALDCAAHCFQYTSLFSLLTSHSS